MTSIHEMKIDANSGQELIVSSRRKTRIGSFVSIGSGEVVQVTTEEGGTVHKWSIDPFVIIHKYVRQPLVVEFLVRLLLVRDLKTNISILIPENKTEYNSISKAYQILKDECVVRRIGKGEYMLNPDMIYPYFNNYYSLVQRWEELLNK